METRLTAIVRAHRHDTTQAGVLVHSLRTQMNHTCFDVVADEYLGKTKVPTQLLETT